MIDYYKVVYTTQHSADNLFISTKVSIVKVTIHLQRFHFFLYLLRLYDDTLIIG